MRNDAESIPLNNPNNNNKNGGSYTLLISPELTNTNHVDDSSDISAAEAQQGQLEQQQQQQQQHLQQPYQSQQGIIQNMSITESSSLGGWVTCASQFSDEDLSEATSTGCNIANINNLQDDDLSIHSKNSLHRHLTLIDLISIGVAATVGSGIFVLCGLIAHDFAGPSTFLCWMIAGLSCCASGLCFAELSGKFSVSGSTYSYVQLTMGEMPAVVAGACITLEYIIASAAVARSWADKVVSFLLKFCAGFEETSMIVNVLQPDNSVSPMAFVISFACVTLLLYGVKESKQVTNFFTITKVTLILFMCVVSLSLFEADNITPLLPAKFGIAGIFRGSTSSFFGYIGFDEICCMGGEVVNPKKNLPRAVLGTIGLVTVLYVFAAIGLVGMVPYNDISVTSGFPDGFKYRGYDVIAKISALGEIFTLPIVVLVTTMAQPRLQYAMAKDGLLPRIFGEVDETGNLWYGTLIAGSVMIVVSTCVPFTYLNDLISAGVLMAFSMTAASVILVRQESPKDQPMLLERSLAKFNVLSLSMGMLIHFGFDDLKGQLLPLINALMLIGLAIKIGSVCPLKSQRNAESYFETPLVPYLPLLAQFLNWYLIAQLGVLYTLLLMGYVGTALLLYFIFKRGTTPLEWKNSETSSSGQSYSSQISMTSVVEEDEKF